MDATKTSNRSGGTSACNKGDPAIIIGVMERRIKATLLGWKPGTSPVIVPNSTPSIENAKSKSKNKKKKESIIFQVIVSPIL
jgi:hypothetical protein